MSIELFGRVVEVTSEELSTDGKQYVRLKFKDAAPFMQDLKIPNSNQLKLNDFVVARISLDPMGRLDDTSDPKR